MNLLKSLFARVPAAYRAQLARFARVAVFAAGPQLLAAAADPKGLTLKAAAAVLTGAFEVAFRAVRPAAPAAPAKPAV